MEVYRQSEDFLALGAAPKASMSLVLQDIATSREERGVFCGIHTAAGKLVGVVDYIPDDFCKTAHVAFISLLMIAAPFRNQGIGTQILNLLENEIEKSGRVSEIQTAVQLNNPAALRFWERNDYHPFGSPEQRPDHTVVSYLRKRLPAQV